MQIYDITRIHGVYEKQPVASRRVCSAPIARQHDKLSLSDDAKDFQAVMRGLKDAPDIRADRVGEILQKYESGSYSADSKDIAGALAKSGLFATK
jgi:negative regulator of flagellin synthesis FlgM